MPSAAAIPEFLGPFFRVDLGILRSLWRSFLPRAASVPIDLRLERQQQSEWCWAAVASAVHHFHDGEAVSQCEVVTGGFPGRDCCARPSSSACNRPFSLARTLQNLGNLAGRPVNGSVPPAEVRGELSAGRPICCGLSRRGAGHFVVITGYRRSGGTTILAIKDPTYGDSLKFVTYAQLRSGYRNATWRQTCLTRRSG